MYNHTKAYLRHSLCRGSMCTAAACPGKLSAHRPRLFSGRNGHALCHVSLPRQQETESLILGQPFRGCELAQSSKLGTNKDGDKMSLSIRLSLMLSLSGIRRRKKYRRREVGAGEKARNQRLRERPSHINAEPWRGAGYQQYLPTARLPHSSALQ